MNYPSEDGSRSSIFVLGNKYKRPEGFMKILLKTFTNII